MKKLFGAVITNYFNDGDEFDTVARDVLWCNSIKEAAEKFAKHAPAYEQPDAKAVAFPFEIDQDELHGCHAAAARKGAHTALKEAWYWDVGNNEVLEVLPEEFIELLRSGYKRIRV